VLLLVDDSAFFAKCWRPVLSRRYKVRVATNRRKSRDLSGRPTFDVVLTDIEMPRQ